MPWVITTLRELFLSIAAWFGSLFGKKAGLAIGYVAASAGLGLALFTAYSGILLGIKVTMPNTGPMEWALGMLPYNTVACVAAYHSARIGWWIYNENKKGLQLLLFR